MAEVIVSGYKFVVDDEDLPLFERYPWKVHKNRGEPAYLSATILFHREVVGAPPGAVVDHINGDPFDNRRENLRIVTTSENLKKKKDWVWRAEVIKRHRVEQPESE